MNGTCNNCKYYEICGDDTRERDYNGFEFEKNEEPEEIDDEYDSFEEWYFAQPSDDV